MGVKEYGRALMYELDELERVGSLQRIEMGKSLYHSPVCGKVSDHIFACVFLVFRLELFGIRHRILDFGVGLL